jgi:hypothetical protein
VPNTSGSESLGDRLRRLYERYVDDYRAYARMRGFRTEVNDWPYVRRSFIECWAEPGFHRFWQVWNPGIGYFVYRLFLRLGGRRRWTGPTLLAFPLCGLAHTLIVVPFFGRWAFSVITAFTCFGLLTVASRRASRILRQGRWPVAVNVLVNVACVAGSFDVGFRVDRLLGL